MFVAIHDAIDDLIVKWRLTIESMLICNKVCLINTSIVFHVVSQNTRLGNVLLHYKWLDNHVKCIAPKVVDFTHEHVCWVKEHHLGFTRMFSNQLHDEFRTIKVLLSFGDFSLFGYGLELLIFAASLLILGYIRLYKFANILRRYEPSLDLDGSGLWAVPHDAILVFEAEK